MKTRIYLKIQMKIIQYKKVKDMNLKQKLVSYIVSQ